MTTLDEKQQEDVIHNDLIVDGWWMDDEYPIGSSSDGSEVLWIILTNLEGEFSGFKAHRSFSEGELYYLKDVEVLPLNKTRKQQWVTEYEREDGKSLWA